MKNFDWLLLAAVVLLSVLGIMMIYSTDGGERGLWTRQLAALLIGFFGFGFFSYLDYRFWRRAAGPIFILSLVLLLLVLVLGEDIRGSQRWFSIGPINFQPAELGKIAFIMVMARFFSDRGDSLFQNFRFVLLSLLYVSLPAALIMFEPDLGSTLILLAIWIGLLIAAHVPWRHFLYLSLLFVLIAALSWNFVLAPYQKDRVMTFLDPTADPLGRGYNVIQSVVAVGSGGVFGQGLARGLQSQLRFLPERQTDFIFASTVEELGLVGGGFLLVCAAVLVFRILRVMRRSQDSFGKYLAAGAFFLFLAQITVNVGMNLGLLPVTGITLPFVSYGGSSLVISLWLIGIIQSIALHSSPVRF